MSDCLFCKILAGEIPAKIVYQDEKCVAFRDINPQAPTHCLVIPREHIPTINDLTPENDALIGYLTRVAKKIAKDEGFAEQGYRLVWNCNRGAGQTVFHVHLHVLGGRIFGWPPG
jgi:histidine triad (HIT) family protein